MGLTNLRNYLVGRGIGIEQHGEQRGKLLDYPPSSRRGRKALAWISMSQLLHQQRRRTNMLLHSIPLHNPSSRQPLPPECSVHQSDLTKRPPLVRLRPHDTLGIVQISHLSVDLVRDLYWRSRRCRSWLIWMLNLYRPILEVCQGLGPSYSKARPDHILTSSDGPPLCNPRPKPLRPIPRRNAPP